MLTNHLLIFAKYPEPGRVKTRLAGAIGFEAAAYRYQEMIETVMRETSPANDEYRRVLWFDPPERENDFRGWFPEVGMRPQCDGDLGRRMLTSFKESLASEDLALPVRAILIGTDCVEIDRSLVCDAFDRLENADLVLGPATDGGYYLIGMKKAHPFLFEEIPWSTEKVFGLTVEKAKRGHLKVELLKTLSDVDG